MIAAKINDQPCRKMPTNRQRRPCWRGEPGTVGNVGFGIAASASPPTASSHQVAMAMANHSRSARSGSIMRVYCHCQPPCLIFLKPCSIQARKPYQQAPAVWGGRSVKINHGSACPASQRANRVQAKRVFGLLKAVPRLAQRRPRADREIVFQRPAVPPVEGKARPRSAGGRQGAGRPRSSAPSAGRSRPHLHRPRRPVPERCAVGTTGPYPSRGEAQSRGGGDRNPFWEERIFCWPVRRTMPTVDYLFIGVFRTLKPEGQRTGLFKDPMARAMIRRSGLVGDHQADHRSHGGPDQAVH